MFHISFSISIVLNIDHEDEDTDEDSDDETDDSGKFLDTDSHFAPQKTFFSFCNRNIF